MDLKGTISISDPIKKYRSGGIVCTNAIYVWILSKYSYKGVMLMMTLLVLIEH